MGDSAVKCFKVSSAFENDLVPLIQLLQNAKEKKELREAQQEEIFGDVFSKLNRDQGTIVEPGSHCKNLQNQCETFVEAWASPSREPRECRFDVTSEPNKLLVNRIQYRECVQEFSEIEKYFCNERPPTEIENEEL